MDKLAERDSIQNYTEPITPTNATNDDSKHLDMSRNINFQNLHNVKLENIPFVNEQSQIKQELPLKFMDFPSISAHHLSPKSQISQQIQQQSPSDFTAFPSANYPPIAVQNAQPFPFNNQLQMPHYLTNAMFPSLMLLNPANTTPFSTQHPLLFKTSNTNNMIDEHAIFADHSTQTKRKRKKRKRDIDESEHDLHDNEHTKINNLSAQSTRKKRRIESIKAEDLYYCEYCNASFVRNCHLSRHIREKHSDSKTTFECKICNKVFDQRSNLKVHLRSHASDKTISHPWLCTECNPHKQFTRKSSLKRHVIKKHKKIAAKLLAQAEVETGPLDNYDESEIEDIVKTEPMQQPDPFALPPDIFIQNVNTNNIPPALD